MNKKIFLILLSLAILLVVPVAVFGIGFPHDNTQAVGCTNCHNATASLGANQFNNMCTNCHKPGSANVNVTAQFYQTDAANIYNRFNGYSAGVIPTGKLKYTSHNWAGSEVAPEAGASKPTDSKMNTSTLGTTLSCARCHNIHGSKSSTVNSSPFLRSLNSDDQMCRDCHRKRDVSNHLLGSHPVNFRYTSATSKVVTKSADYFSTPRNANPANPSSAIKLVNGKIMCTSCHAIHYADSNSGTVDGRSNWANLSSSRGMLLRTDTFGKTDSITSVNICTNCHNKPNHQVYTGSKTNSMPIQCVDCHSGHVEYLKPEDVALGGVNATPNVYMLRRYVNYSAGIKLDSYRRKAFLTSTSSTAPLLNSSGNAICQACHTPPPTISDHLTATNKDKCIVCHGGTLHSTAKPIGCSDCHGFPPQHNVAGNIKYGAAQSLGYAVYSGAKSYFSASGGLIFKNESTAGHPTHAAGKPYSFACSECHKGNNHYQQSYQEVFNDKSGILAGNSAIFAAGNASSSCSNMYCHSYGTATLTGAKSVNWATGVRGSIAGTVDECVACHNGVTTNFNNMSTGSHFRHVSKNPSTGKLITCNVCHSATVSGNTAISNYTNHVNGVRNLAVDATAVGGKVSGSTLSGTTCTTYCHSNGNGAAPIVTPNWTDRNSGKCGACHLTAVNTGSGIMSSNAHFTHISSNYGPKRNNNNLCSTCHVFTGELSGTHVDGSISKNANGSGPTFCQNCHAQSVPVWTNPTRLTCQSCHSGMGNGTTESVANRSWSMYNAAAGGGVQAPYKSYSTFNNRGHGSFTNSNSCSKCHDSTSKHIDQVLGSTDKRLFTPNDNTQCSSCHSNPAIVTTASRQDMNTHRRLGASPSEYQTANGTSTCNACHDPHGNGLNRSMIRSTINGKTISFSNNTTGFISKQSANGFYAGVCQVCHTKTTAFRNTTTSAAGNWTTHYSDRRCTDCHNHKQASNVAFLPMAGGCSGCHGYPPVPNMAGLGVHNSYTGAKLEPYATGGGNHHLAHLSPTVKPSDGFAPCLPCHPNNSHAQGGGTVIRANVQVVVPVSLAFDSSRTTRYNAVAYSCSNVSCHFQPTPSW